MAALKDMYSPAFVKNLTKGLTEVYPKLNAKAFQQFIFDKHWEARELKDRMYHISKAIRAFVPESYEKTIPILFRLIPVMRTMGYKDQNFEFMFLPDFVEKNGIDFPELSAKAFVEMTQFVSCEFAVRPFIIKYPEEYSKFMLQCASHKNPNVRRFASEGMRPRLPWGMALPAYKKNPAPVLPILEKLKADPSEYVRKSVANNLNDISKDHPELLIKLIDQWSGKNELTDKLLKHAARTLLKAGNKNALALFGVHQHPDWYSIENVKVSNKVKIGEKLNFQFVLKNKKKKPVYARLEYKIYFLLNNNKHNSKVYKITEKEIGANETIEINTSQSFRIITTRTYYKGLHYFALVVNGEEGSSLPFQLS